MITLHGVLTDISRFIMVSSLFSSSKLKVAAQLGADYWSVVGGINR
jgi:hypothetical protein